MHAVGRQLAPLLCGQVSGYQPAEVAPTAAAAAGLWLGGHATSIGVAEAAAMLTERLPAAAEGAEAGFPPPILLASVSLLTGFPLRFHPFSLGFSS
eukprot:COSAG01_NODE_373_length_17991_cov_284.890075_23_plen_96_part_00